MSPINLLTYYERNIKYILIHKHSIEEENINLLDNIRLTIKAITVVEDDILIKDSLQLLEAISGKKSNGFGTYKYIGATKKFFFTGFVDLRKEKLFVFLTYLVTCCLPIYIKRNGTETVEIYDNTYKFKLVDNTIFYNFKKINFKGICQVICSGKKKSKLNYMEDLLILLKVK